MRPRRSRRGLTLMEVLVAVSLLSLLSAGLLTAFRVGASAWESTTHRLTLDRRIAMVNAILHAEMEGLFPIQAEYQIPPQTTPSTFLFFQGQPDAMRFVSSYSLVEGPRGGLRLVELQILETERGLRIVMNEFPYGGPRAAGQLVTAAEQDPASREMRLSFVPIRAQSASFVIADELAGGSFSYMIPETAFEPPRWVAAWTRTYQIPGAVKIELNPRPDPSRLLPVTVTVPIRATLSVF